MKCGMDARAQVAVAVRKHDVADQLQQELLAWEIVSSGALEAIPSAFTAPQSASGGAASAQAPSRGGQQRPKQPGGGGGSGKGQEAQQKKPQQRNPSS